MRSRRLQNQGDGARLTSPRRRGSSGGDAPAAVMMLGDRVSVVPRRRWSPAGGRYAAPTVEDRSRLEEDTWAEARCAGSLVPRGSGELPPAAFSRLTCGTCWAQGSTEMRRARVRGGGETGPDVRVQLQACWRWTLNLGCTWASGDVTHRRLQEHGSAARRFFARTLQLEAR